MRNYLKIFWTNAEFHFKKLKYWRKKYPQLEFSKVHVPKIIFVILVSSKIWSENNSAKIVAENQHGLNVKNLLITVSFLNFIYTNSKCQDFFKIMLNAIWNILFISLRWIKQYFCSPFSLHKFIANAKIFLNIYWMSFETYNL